MSDRDYCYPPDCTVLRNELDIRDALALEAAERKLVAQRFLEPMPAGDFDLDHLKAIPPSPVPGRLRLGGEVRTVEIAKGASEFQPRRCIEVGTAIVRSRIAAAGKKQSCELSRRP